MTTHTVAATDAVSEIVPTVTHGIPVIDMNDWYAQDASRRKKFVKGLDEAFRTVGFVAVINPNLPKEVLDAGYKQAATFFQTTQ